MKLLPSMKQLQYLVALADTEHFGKASEGCNVTPSTLSAGIQDLEKILGVPLAERNKRRVIITPLGEEIALHARTILHEAEDIMDLVMSNREPLSGDLRLGVIPTISPFLLPQVLPAIRKLYPSLRLFLEEDLTRPLLDQLQEGAIDLALIAIPFDTGAVKTHALFEDKFLFAVNRHHPLARKKKITLDDMREEPLLLLEEGHCLRAHALEACKLTGSHVRSKFEASSFHTLVQMVDSGIGVTLLPELAIDAHITEGTSIKLIPLSEESRRQITLVWRPTSLRAHEFELLGDLLRRIAVK